MKAIIEEDIIISLTEHGNTEIGNLPSDVGLERLRWDGNKIIDLIDLTEIWVRFKNGVFELHCIEVSDSQLVQMTYRDRKKLIKNSNEIRIKTETEILQEEKTRLIKIAKNILENKFGNYIDLELSQLALICALIVYTRQQPQQLADFFDSIIPYIKDIFPMERWEQKLKTFALKSKQFLDEYYTDLDNI